MDPYHDRRLDDRNKRRPSTAPTVLRMSRLRWLAFELVVLSMGLMMSCSTLPVPSDSLPPTNVSKLLSINTPTLQPVISRPTNTVAPTKMPALRLTAVAKSTQVALYLCPPTHLTRQPPAALPGTSVAGKSTPLPLNAVIAVADRLNKQLSQNDYSAAISGFDEALKVILSETQLKQVWEVFIQQYGHLQPKRSASGVVNSKDRYDAVATAFEFEETSYGLLVIVDTTSGKISGLCPLPLVDLKQ